MAEADALGAGFVKAATVVQGAVGTNSAFGSGLAGAAVSARKALAPAAPAAPTPGPADGSADASAMALINQNFTNFGLNANQQVSATDARTLAQWAWQEHLNGVADAQIALDLRQTDPWKQAYSGMAALQAQGVSITEAQYQTKESDDMSLLQAYGVPPAMAQDKQFLGRIIGGQVSTTELQNRLQDYQTAVNDVSGETKDYLRSQYGIDSGDLMGLFLNPDVGEQLIHQKVAAAQIGVAAQQAGAPALDGATALQLAGLGVSQAQAQTGFQKVAQQQELTQNLGDNTGSVSQSDLVAAQVAGDGAAQQKLANVAAGRVAAFQGGGSFSQSNSGVVGLKNANQGT